MAPWELCLSYSLDPGGQKGVPNAPHKISNKMFEVLDHLPPISQMHPWAIFLGSLLDPVGKKWIPNGMVGFLEKRPRCQATSTQSLGWSASVPSWTLMVKGGVPMESFCVEGVILEEGVQLLQTYP